MANVAPPGLATFTYPASVLINAVPTVVQLPAATYRLFTYDAGTSTPRTTWSDAGETSANTNPITLNANGQAQIFYRGNYRLELRQPVALGGAVIWTVDNFNVPDPTAATSTVFANGSAATPSVRFAQAVSSGLFSPAANAVAMSIGGAEVQRWTGGNVAIGGTVPLAKQHVFGTGRFDGALTVSTGGVTIAAGGYTVTGNSSVAGNLTVTAGLFTSRGFVDNATAAAWNIDASGRLLNNGTAQPAFAAYRASSQQNSGTTLIFNTEQFDQGSNYNNATGIFTAPLAGVYVFSASAEFTNSTGGNVGMQLRIVGNTAGEVASQSALYATGTTFSVSCSVVVRLAANETVQVTTNTALAALFVMTATTYTRFSGALLY